MKFEFVGLNRVKYWRCLFASVAQTAFGLHFLPKADHESVWDGWVVEPPLDLLQRHKHDAVPATESEKDGVQALEEGFYASLAVDVLGYG